MFAVCLFEELPFQAIELVSRRHTEKGKETFRITFCCEYASWQLPSELTVYVVPAFPCLLFFIPHQRLGRRPPPFVVQGLKFSCSFYFRFNKLYVNPTLRHTQSLKFFSVVFLRRFHLQFNQDTNECVAFFSSIHAFNVPVRFHRN